MMNSIIIAAKISCVGLFCLILGVTLPVQAQNITVHIKDKQFVETYFPSLGQHNVSAGLEPSNSVTNFITNQWWANGLAKGVKMDNRGSMTIPASAEPYYKIDNLKLYILPGDELQVDLTNIRKPSMVAFSGKNAAANKWLNQDELSLYAPIVDQSGFFIPNQSYQEYRLKVLNKGLKLNTVLDDLPVNLKFKEDSRIRLNFLTIAALLNYVNKDRLMLEKSAILRYGIPNADTTGSRQTLTMADAFYLSKRDSVLKDVNQLLPAQLLQNYYDFPEVVTALESLTTFDPAMVTEKRFPGFAAIHYLITSINDASDVSKFFYSGKLDTMAKNTHDPSLHRLMASWLQTYRKLQPQQPVMDFDLEDENGKIAKLSDFKGKAIYIDFWATWCNPCLAVKPDFEKLAAENNKQGVIFLSVSKDRNKELWKKYLKTHEASSNVHEFVLRNEHELDQLYQLYFIPRFILINKDFRFISAMAPLPVVSEIKHTIEQLDINN